jgi:hypothetical protein
MAKAKSKASAADVIPEPPRVSVDPLNPKLTAPMCARLMWLRTRRRKLESEVRAISAEEHPIADCALAFLEANDKQSAKRGDYIASEKIGNAYPKWKDAFVDAMGSDAAQAVQDAAPRSVSIEIKLVK